MPIQTKQAPAYPIKSAEAVIPLVLQEKEVIFADLETTGFGAYSDITEIGAIKVNVDTGKVLSRFSTLVHLKIQKRVPKKIEELTGITTEMLEDAPSLERVLPAFQQFLGDSVVSFHNAQFDWPMLQKKYACIGQQLNNEVICTVKLFRFLHPEQKLSNLDAVTAFYGAPIEGHHRAYVDCKWTAASYRKMRQELLAMQDNLQISMSDAAPTAKKVHEMTLNELMASCIVHRITGWEKGGKSRIYCTTSIADFYYDLKEHVWNVARKKVPYNLNVETLSKFILQKLKMDQMQFESYYAPRKEA